MHTYVTRSLLILSVALAACGGDKPAPETSAAAKEQVSPDDYRKQQQRYADSLLNASRTSKEIVGKLGKDYAVGSTRLRDTLGLLAGNTKCFANGRSSDPYLAGTVSFFVYMSVVGSNVVRVQESQWSSPAGNIVDACLNLESKNWKFDASFGKPAAYISQVQFK